MSALLGAASGRGLFLVGGLGAPYDALLAATLRARGLDARTLGPMDRDAYERGRARLARNPCAPLLYTTGALLRTASALEPRTAATALGVTTCGPCRFALFAPAWRRALDAEGCSRVRTLVVGQDPTALHGLVGAEGTRALLDAIAAGDALAEVVRRLAPHVEDVDALESAAAQALDSMLRRIETGEAPIEALASVRAFHAALPRQTPSPLGRVVLIGEPWSLHVDGAPQLHLPRVLARAGVEIEVPPLSLWVALRAWEARQPTWGGGAPTSDLHAWVALDAQIRDSLARACTAAGLGGLELPDLDALAALARPWLPSDVRGGYGHVEVALALRARAERRAHAVISVKSFGCIPSSGLADAIVPVALAQGADAMPFLALEVSHDGAAARESRLMMRVAGALREAHRELEAARASRPMPLPPIDPLAGTHETGARPYACTLACEVARLERRGRS